MTLARGLLGISLLLFSPLAAAQMREPLNTGSIPTSQLPQALNQVSIEQKLGAQLPLGLKFRDELGRSVRLSDVLSGDRPTILTLAYFRCPSLCTLVLNGVVDAARALAPGLTLGRDFRIVTVSINPRESPPLALAKKRSYLARYGGLAMDDDSPAWRMLTGDENSIHALAQAVGFHYTYSTKTGEFAHASVAMVLTPGGRMSRYLFGIHYPATELGSALREARGSHIGSPIAAVLLYCFRYDPARGTWSPRILNWLRAFAAATLLVVGAGLALAWRKERAA